MEYVETDTAAVPGTEAKTLIIASELLPQEDIIDTIGVDKFDSDGNTVTDKEIIESMHIQYKPLTHNVLVKPLPPVMVTKTITELDEKRNKNVKPGGELKTKEVTKEVEANYRTGIVLAVGNQVNSVNGYIIEVGDIVVFPARVLNTCKFELLKDSLMLKHYDIEAVLIAK